MLSIIISSYQPSYYNQLAQNIHKSIGENFEYEIIRIENPNMMSIAKAYNLGAKRAQFLNLLFLHEDVIFHTQNWGKKIIDYLKNSTTGVVGVAGSSYVPKAPSSWTVSSKYNFINILQGNKLDNSFQKIKTTTSDKHNVFAVDGVFMAISKEHFNTIYFNEEITGFHGYDLDFSLRCSEKYQNIVISDIEIQHFSSGNPDKKWFENNIHIRKNLAGRFQKKNDSETEKECFINFLYRYFRFNTVNFSNIIFTLKFFPFFRLNFYDFCQILKKYFYYILYAKDLNKKKQ